MWTANLVPGQGFHPFTVYKSTTGLTTTGRPIDGALEKTDVTFYGQLVGATQKEKEQWKQNGHPISHKIIEYSAMKKAGATDYLMSKDRQFYVQGVKNPGDLNVTMIYYIEERFDIRKE